MAIYNIHITAENTYQINKFDDDLNVESSYEVSDEECSCPQGHKPTCRHRKMLAIFLAAQAIDTDKFYNYGTHQWEAVSYDYQDDVV